MKRLILMLLAVALLCAGCSSKTPAQTTEPAETVPVTTAAPETLPPETTEETLPVPEVEYATARADKLPAVLMLLSRGEKVGVVGEYDENHVVIKTEEGYGLVEKPLVRMDAAPAFETATGYARYNSRFFDNFRLSGEPLQTLKTNTKLELLEDLGWCYLAELEGVCGYIAKDSVSSSPIKGGTGNSSADGGDISLMVPGVMPLFSLTPQTGDVTGEAVVLADRVPVILGYYDRGDEIPVVAEEGFAESWEGYHTIWLDGLYAYVEKTMTLGAGEVPMEAWDGYAKYKAALHDNYWLLGEAIQDLKTNTAVHVIDELPDSYLVEVDGVLGFIAKDMVSKTKITGGSGNSSSEWSPPAM